MERLRKLAKVFVYTVLIVVGVWLGVVIGAWVGIIAGSLLGQLWVNLS